MEKEYLQSGFDPQTLETAQLKRILDENNVDYPSDSRKSKLVRLFNNHVAVQAPTATETPSPIVTKKEKKKKRATKKEQTDESKEEQSDELKEEQKEEELKEEMKEDHAEDEADDSVIKKSSEPKGSSHRVTKIDKKKKKAKRVKSRPEDTSDSKHDLSANLETKKSPSTSTVATPTKTVTPSKTSKGSSASESASKKRKSMLNDSDLKVSGTPSKGNLFEIESESESDLLSPNVKRLKTSKANQSHVSDSSIVNSSHEAPATPGSSRLAVDKTLTPKAPVSDILEPPPKVLEGTSSSNSPQVTKAEAPGKDDASVDVSASLNDFLSADATDSSEFDSALMKLKATHAPVNASPSSKNEELAKLLNIDPKRIKAKPRSSRNVTPRRPIIISESLLERQNDELSEEEVPEKRARVAPTEFYNNSDLSSDSENEGSEDLTLQVSDEKALDKKPESAVTHRSIWPSVLRFILYLSIWLTLVGTSFFAYWYREQSFYVGYCGHEIYKRTVPQTPETPQLLVLLGDYLDSNFKPQCAECPQHARCFPRFEMACYDDFYKHTPWYFNLYPSINPQGQYCVPDTKKAEKIEIMIDVALDLLRARNANRDCGKAPESDLDAGIGISDLHDLLLSMKAPYITEEEFEELWKRSISELEKEPEIIVRQVTDFQGSQDPHKSFEGHSEHLLTSQVGFASDNVVSGIDPNNTAPTQNVEDKILRSTSLSHISLKCMMSNTLLGMVVKFKRSLAVLAAVILGVVFAHYKYKDFKLQVKKVDTLYTEVLRRLKKQAKLSLETGNQPAYIGSIHLRDLILSEEHNLSKKMRLWQAVSRKVDRNTNVSHQLIEVHGEVMKVWEWISVLEE